MEIKHCFVFSLRATVFATVLRLAVGMLSQKKWQSWCVYGVCDIYHYYLIWKDDISWKLIIIVNSVAFYPYYLNLV